MITNMQTKLTAAAAVVIALLMPLTAVAGPIDLLPGRWTGWGQLTMAGGEIEKVKCIATYFRGSSGGQLRHNLRCASTNYTIDAVADLQVAGSRVSGEWEERKYAAGGAVLGRVIGDGISVDITGPAFTATLKVATTKCQQTMDIAPQGLGVSRIAVKLAKC